MFGKFFLRVFVGLIAAGLVTGGKALVVAVGAVVCTFGAGLVVVLPAAYLVGLVLTIWFIPFGSEPESVPERLPRENRVSEKSAAGSNKRDAVERFIHVGFHYGRSWELIHDQCIGAGWDEELIQEAYKAVRVRERCDY